MTPFTLPYPQSSPPTLHVSQDEGGDTHHRPACSCRGRHSMSIHSKVSKGWGHDRVTNSAPGDLCPYLNLEIAGHKFPPCLFMMSYCAGLVICSLLGHWYRHMSRRGHIVFTVIHIRSGLAARIHVIAVAPTHSPQLPRCLNHAGSLSPFRVSSWVFLCKNVNISAPWICLPYGWVRIPAQFVKTALVHASHTPVLHASQSGFTIVEYLAHFSFRNIVLSPLSEILFY